MLHVTEGWALGQPGPEGGQGDRIPFSLAAHGPIGIVPHPARQVQGPGLALGEAPEADPLDGSADTKGGAQGSYPLKVDSKAAPLARISGQLRSRRRGVALIHPSSTASASEPGLFA